MILKHFNQNLVSVPTQNRLQVATNDISIQEFHNVTLEIYPQGQQVQQGLPPIAGRT